MPYVRTEGDEPIVDHPGCLHFLSKGMMVSGQLRPTHEEHGMGDGHCWCNLTQRWLGPDRELVDRKMCVPGRGCYAGRV